MGSPRPLGKKTQTGSPPLHPPGPANAVNWLRCLKGQEGVENRGGGGGKKNSGSGPQSILTKNPGEDGWGETQNVKKVVNQRKKKRDSAGFSKSKRNKKSSYIGGGSLGGNRKKKEKPPWAGTLGSDKLVPAGRKIVR